MKGRIMVNAGPGNRRSRDTGAMEQSNKEDEAGHQGTGQEIPPVQQREPEPTSEKETLEAVDKRLEKFAKSTSTHGVVYILTGKSKIRRLFWLVVFLLAAGSCLFTIVNRILYLVDGPTSTTISVRPQRTLTFPAVTVCNLNLVRRSYLDYLNLTGSVRDVFNAELTPDGLNVSECINTVNVSIDFDQIVLEGRSIFQLFVIDCYFQGVRCEDLPNDPWTPTFTRLGLCYAFNARQDEDEILTVNGTGTGHSLLLTLNIQEDEYVTSSTGGIGVKLAIHPQTSQGEPDDIGIGVPPGRNAFISLRERRISDESRDRDCRRQSNTNSFEFLSSDYEYSINACIRDCFITNIAENCGCLESSLFDADQYEGEYSSLPLCDQEQFCCLLSEYRRAHGCGTTCPASCTETQYRTSTSYSAFPARFLAEQLTSQLELLLQSNDTIDVEPDLQPTLDDVYRIYKNVTINEGFLEDNLLSVNIYFEDLNYEEEVTEDAYGVVALLSDIGGQLSLFLGASVLSMIEFAVWILDETRDRCCGERVHSWLKELWDWLRRKTSRKPVPNDTELERADSGGEET